MTSLLAGSMTIVFLLLDHLDLFVRLDDPVGHRLGAQVLNGFQNFPLLVRDRFGQGLRPVEIVAHHRNDLRVVEQRHDAAIPSRLWLEFRLCLDLDEIPLRFNGSGAERGKRIRSAPQVRPGKARWRATNTSNSSAVSGSGANGSSAWEPRPPPLFPAPDRRLGSSPNQTGQGRTTSE